VGMNLAALLDELPAVLRDRRHLMAEPRQVPLEEFADVRLVVGDGDAQGANHTSPRGKVTRMRAPPAASAASTVPPWASAMRRTRARPRPMPPGLVVKNGSKALARCSPVRPGPLSATETHTAGRPARFSVAARTVMRAGSGAAAR